MYRVYLKCGKMKNGATKQYYLLKRYLLTIT